MTRYRFDFKQAALALFALVIQAQAATTDLASAPLVTSATSSVLPNILFVLDDSGSMDWDYLPDWANDSSPPEYRYKNSDFNGVAYNPAVTYSPPSYFNTDGTVNTTTYPTQSAANTSNWTAVKNDGYGVQSTGTSNLVNNAYYFLTIAGQYCSDHALRDCNTQSSASASYSYIAKLRWCNSSALTTCQANYNATSGYGYTFPRMPSPTTATITVSGSTTGAVSNIKVSGLEILSAATSGSSTASTVASRIVSNINSCTKQISGNCTVVGYSATLSGSVVTITAPDGNTYTPVLTSTGGMSYATSAFTAGSVPGSVFRQTITSTITSYAYPDTSAKASTRTDCAGTTCTYGDEMTNYANWWAYYRTRMQMMKSSASLAFATLGSSYRVGFMSINSNTGGYIPVDQFNAANKHSWYAKLFAANPGNGTPLRVALTAAGRYYAGKKPTYTSPESSVSISMTDDPIQYSCQQSFTILSTDGYWNESTTPKQIDGVTSIGNQDDVEPRPFNDGASVTYLKTTSQLQETKTQVYASTSQLQKRVLQIQQRTQQIQTRTSVTQNVTGQLYTRTSSNSGASWGDWSAVSSCSQDSSGSTRTDCMVGSLQKRTSSNSGSSWTSWASASSCSVDSSGSNRVQCQIYQNWTTVASCSPTRTGTLGSYAYTGGGSAVDCQTATSAWSNVPSCTAGPGVECQTTDTGWSNASSCTPSGPVNGQTITCQTIDAGWVGASACAAGSSGGATTTCQTVAGGPTLTTSCAAQSASLSNDYVQTTCSTVTVQPAMGVSSCTAVAAAVANSYTTTACNTVNIGPTTESSCTAQTAGSSNNWLSIGCVVNATGGTSNTLADVAEYYYATDLRTSTLGNCSVTVTSGGSTTTNDVCNNNVPRSDADTASWQHMTTMTLGLGASGLMQYQSGYAKLTSGDYYDVAHGTGANPTGGVCSWQSSGSCNWPTPSSGTQTTIDDLWHAAVNGRGTYYSATNPASLVNGLSSALAGVTARTGASAAATTSNPNVTSGDNFVFSSTFTTLNWDGELVRQQLDLTTGEVLPTIDWSAQAKLDANTSRNIYTFDSTAASKLKVFQWSSLTASEQAYFTTPSISTLSQFCASGVTCLSGASQSAASGVSLVDFLRGDRTNEGAADDTAKYFRQRAHVLGDIVNAEAVYVKSTLYNYADFGYSTFVTSNASRQGMVYVAANDGMLHAFYAADGSSGIVGGGEAWAYVPTLVMSNMYKLADKNYASQHQYLVDGTPVVGDICTSNCPTPVPPATSSPAVWKTILVGGLNGGGRGYYALDITEPASPKALWEFTDTNMGYTYGNPEITKAADGTWVVLVTSGYNNVSPGDGVGRLYVLNAATGALIRTISTGAGSTTTPSGLARIRAWVTNAMADNTSLRVYGGDVLGNLWRFDINGNVGAAGYDAQLMVTLKDANNNFQPITSRPELGSYNGIPLVFVGTGRYLGASDLSDTSSQTMYGIKDNLDATNYGSPRSSTTGHFVAQILTTTSCPPGTPTTICGTGETVRTSSNNVVNYASDSGWYLDFPDTGERANTDPVLALGTLAFTTNTPDSSACTVGGYSEIYFLDYRTGGSVSTSAGVVGTSLGNELATRPVLVRLPGNTIVAITRGSGGTNQTSNAPIGSGSGVTKRISWRELISDD